LRRVLNKSKQAVWVPGSADTVCHRPPLTLTFDRLTLKLVRESHLRRGTFLPNLGTLGIWVLELFTMYETDRQTNGRTKAMLIAPFPTLGGIIISENEKQDSNSDNNNPVQE